MDLNQKFENWISLPTKDAMKILPHPDSVEARYFNAKVILQFLEKKLESNEESKYEFDTPEQIQKRIAIWKELITQMDSKQNLA